jgi:hypothetical protein
MCSPQKYSNFHKKNKSFLANMEARIDSEIRHL